MKKLVFMFVAFAAISFASCGNKAAEPAEVIDEAIEVAEEDTLTTDSLVTDSVAADSLAADTTVVPAA